MAFFRKKGLNLSQFDDPGHHNGIISILFYIKLIADLTEKTKTFSKDLFLRYSGSFFLLKVSYHVFALSRSYELNHNAVIIFAEMSCLPGFAATARQQSSGPKLCVMINNRRLYLSLNLWKN